MIDWLFLWSSRRPPIWEAVTQNMNNVFWKNNNEFDDYIFSVNKNDIPEKFHTHLDIDKFSGPILDQFENEAFKYVIEPNDGLSKYNRQDHLVLKQHMFPNMSLNETNCKTINLDRIYELVQKYEWVSLGVIFSNADEEKRLNKLNILATSVLYTRDKDTLQIINLDGGNQPDNNINYLNCISYITFRQLKDKNIVMGVLNPHLVALTHTENRILNEVHRLSSMDTHDTLIEDYLLKPEVYFGKVVGDTIFSINNSVIIKQFQDSLFWHRYGQLPNMPVDIDTNLNYEVVGNEIHINTDKKIGYISLIYDVGTMTISDELKKQMYGKIKIDYKVIGE